MLRNINQEIKNVVRCYECGQLIQSHNSAIQFHYTVVHNLYNQPSKRDKGWRFAPSSLK